MKIELEPTSTFETVNGVPARVWTGKTDKGVPVKAWVTVVQPQTHDAESLRAFELELSELKGKRELISFDLRLVL